MLLDNLNLEEEQFEEAGDFIPQGGFVNDTGIYNCLIDLAYLGQSTGKAHSVTIHFRQADGKMTHRETFYITSGEKKGTKPFYIKDGKRYALPGYEAMNSLALIATGKPLGQLSSEKKVVKLWNFESRSEEPTEVSLVTEMIGKPVKVGLVKCRENKRKKVGDEYIDTNEVREFNEAQKFFFANKFSTTEVKAKVTTPEFHDKWLKKYPPEFVRDRYVAVEGVPAAVDAASASSAAASADINGSLFA